MGVNASCCAAARDEVEWCETDDWEDAPMEEMLQHVEIVSKRNSDFQKRFGLSAREPLLRVVHKVGLHTQFARCIRGSLFLSPDYLCFYSEDLGLVIPFSAIQNVRHTILGRIEMTTCERKFVFSWLPDRVKLQDILESMVEDASELVNMENLLLGQEEARAPEEGTPVVSCEKLLTSRDWETLLRGAAIQSWAAGEVIVEEGSTTRQLFRVRKGVVRVERRGQVLSMLHEGQMFGELTLVDKGKVSATIIAETDTQCWCIRGHYLDDEFFIRPALSHRFYRMLSVSLASKITSALTLLDRAPLREPTIYTSSLLGASLMISKNSSREELGLEENKEKDRHKFHRRFHLGDGFVEDFESALCVLERTVVSEDDKLMQPPVSGTLYVTASMVFFYGQIFKSKIRKVFPLLDIAGIESSEEKKEQEITVFLLNGERLSFSAFCDDATRLNMFHRIHDLWLRILGEAGTQRDAIAPDSHPKTMKDTEALSLDDWALLFHAAHTLSFHRNSVIVWEGCRALKILQVNKGRIRAIRGIDRSNPRVIGTYREGDIIGEINFLEGKGSSETLIAASDVVQVLVIDGAFLYSLFQVVPSLSGRFYRFLAGRLARRLRRSNDILGPTLRPLSKEEMPSSPRSREAAFFCKRDSKSILHLFRRSRSDLIPVKTEEKSNRKSMIMRKIRTLSSRVDMDALTKQNPTDLSSDDWNLLLQGAGLQTYGPEDVIIHQGELLHSLFFIAHGNVRVELGSRIIARLNAHEVFGEVSFLLGSPISVSVTGESQCGVHVVEHTHLRKLLADHPVFAVRFMRFVAYELSKHLKASCECEPTTSFRSSPSDYGLVIANAAKRPWCDGQSASDLLEFHFEGPTARHAAKFRKRFNLSLSENLLMERPCFKNGRITKNGHLFISSNHVAFFARIFGHATRKLWEYADILSIGRVDARGLGIMLVSGKFTLFLFRQPEEREEIHTLMQSMWHTHTSPASTEKSADPRKVEGSDPLDSKPRTGALSRNDWKTILTEIDCISQDVEPGRIIISEGSESPCLFQVVQGLFRVEKTIHGKQITLAHLCEGDVFGEMSFLLGSHATATVIAEAEKGEVHRLDGELLKNLLWRQPTLGARFYEHLTIQLAGRLYDTHDTH